MISKTQAFFIKIPNNPSIKLYLKQIGDEKGKPCLFVHGSMENRKIFYSDKGKGLAHFMAENGFCCYIMDMRGRGKSEPYLSKSFEGGQHEVICEDIPAVVDFIKNRHTETLHTVTHSWGGVVLLSYMARYKPENMGKMLHFGVKRSIGAKSLEKFFKVDFVWGFLGKLLTQIYGYFPAVKLGIGAENEPKNYFFELNSWVPENSKWIDPKDGFDYAQAAKEFVFPKAIFVHAVNDRVLGYKKDIQNFMNECSSHLFQLMSIGKQLGNLEDYDHVSMLTSKNAPTDHFVSLVDWMNTAG